MPIARARAHARWKEATKRLDAQRRRLERSVATVGELLGDRSGTSIRIASDVLRMAVASSNLQDRQRALERLFSVVPVDNVAAGPRLIEHLEAYEGIVLSLHASIESQISNLADVSEVVKQIEVSAGALSDHEVHELTQMAGRSPRAAKQMLGVRIMRARARDQATGLSTQALTSGVTTGLRWASMLERTDGAFSDRLVNELAEVENYPNDSHKNGTEDHWGRLCEGHRLLAAILGPARELSFRRLREDVGAMARFTADCQEPIPTPAGGRVPHYGRHVRKRIVGVCDELSRGLFVRSDTKPLATVWAQIAALLIKDDRATGLPLEPDPLCRRVLQDHQSIHNLCCL